MLVSTHRSRRTLTGRAVLGLVALGLLVCGVPTFRSGAAEPELGAAPGVAPAGKPAASQSDVIVNGNPPGSGAEPLSVVKAGNQFAVDLYGQLGKSHTDNLFFSPSSISIALTMTAAGARGQTQAEIARVLCLGNRLDAAHEEYCGLLATWNGPGEDRPYQLRVANRLWVQDGYPLLAPFVELTGNDYGAAIGPLDFGDSPETSREVINEWVLDRTEQKIKDLLPAGSITHGTRLVLTNAVYFKAPWATRFDGGRTYDRDFLVSPEERVKISMMGERDTFGYAETADVQVLDMPYRGDDLSMVVVLPRKTDGLTVVERSLTVDRLDGWLAAITRREVDVTLPRFKIEASLSLNETLQAMGIRQAFTLAADFTGISSAPRGLELFLSDVVHKGCVAVDEKGTEAAVATAGEIAAKGDFDPTAEPVPTFRADHPFLFLIRDTKTDSILFVGRLTNPEAATNPATEEKL